MADYEFVMKYNCKCGKNNSVSFSRSKINAIDIESFRKLLTCPDCKAKITITEIEKLIVEDKSVRKEVVENVSIN